MRTLRAALLALFVVLICLGLDWTSRAGPKPPRAAKALDLYVVSGQVFVPGSRAAVRVMTRAVASITRSRPLAGARVTIELSDKHRQTLLFDGRSDGNGAAQAAFTVPRWPAGSYQMEVRVRSAAGAQVVRRAVQLKQAGRVLLVTDKPIYQPRQTMHLRALALGTHDLRPLANEQLQFQVMDPRGNKVFKQTLRSDRFGVAATTFALASEINQGKYQIEVRALRRDAAAPAARTVVVKKYVLPKFKVALETDHRYYLPRQRVKGTVRADYFFGKPVAGGKVQVVASTYDGVAFKRFTTMTGRTDPRGQWTFEIALPSYFVGQSLRKGNAQVKLEVKVTDTANHAQRSARSLPVAAAPMRLMAVPEGGRLVPGVKNQIFIVASYPDGSPAQAEVTVARGKQRLAKLRTDAAGLARLELTPDEKLTRQGRYYTVTRVGRPSVSARTRVLELSLSARDDLGNRATARSSLSTAPRQDRLLLRTDKAIYRAGDQLRATVLGAGSEGDTIYLDLVKSSQTLMTRAVRLRQGRGELRLPLGQDVFGTVELHAYRIQADGEITRDARVLYVQPANQLKVAVTPDKRVYRPGERALIRFKVTDAAGEGRARGGRGGVRAARAQAGAGEGLLHPGASAVAAPGPAGARSGGQPASDDQGPPAGGPPAASGQGAVGAGHSPGQARALGQPGGRPPATRKARSVLHPQRDPAVGQRRQAAGASAGRRLGIPRQAGPEAGQARLPGAATRQGPPGRPLLCAQHRAAVA